MQAHPNLKAFFTAVLAVLLLGIVSRTHAVDLGIDVLQKHDFAPLRGKRVGLITNQTGVNSQGERTRVILKKAKGVNLVALFTPEHGLDGTELAGKYVSSRRDSATGLIAHSLYGPTRKPTPEMLRGIDVLVYDMQDIGARSYTYISTMVRCMEAAGENNVEFMVLDRPNPLGGNRVEGPLIEQRWISFVGQVPVPYVHGMTAGELARMTNAKGWNAARCNLSVIKMEGWDRNETWDDTGLRWVRTSPNIPRASSPIYYVATGIVGSLSGMDLGIGGSSPFEYVTAPWIDGAAYTRRLRSLNMPGVEFTAMKHGVRLRIDPDADANITALAVHLVAETNRGARPDLFARTKGSTLDIFYKVYGSTSIQRDIRAGVPAQRIINSWNDHIARFRRDRAPFLLY